MTEEQLRKRLQHLDWDEDEVQAQIDQWNDYRQRDQEEREYLEKQERKDEKRPA